MTTVQNKFRAAVCSLLALMLIFTMFSFPADVSAIQLDKTTYSLTKGYGIILKASGASGSVKWSSSDTSVATVGSDGKVIGKNVGTSVITAKAGGETASCTVTVVGGKILTSTDSVKLEVGQYKQITVRAKGSHGLKVASSDKNIVTGGWVKPWNGDDIKLRLTGRSAGTTTVKVMMTKYPDVYKTIKVTVGKDNSVLAASQNAVSVKAGEKGSVIIYSDDPTQVAYSFSDKNVAKVTSDKWKNSYCTLEIEGLKNGTTKLTVYRKDSSSLKEVITITVGEGTYYTPVSSIPAKTASSDQIYKWYNSTKKSYRYMLVPAKYDWATINSTVAADIGKYEYYTVYEKTPSKQITSDSVINFNTKVNAKTVTRYILVPAGYDTAACNTAVAGYTGEYNYWTVYTTDVTKNKLLASDIVKSWTKNIGGKSVTRFVIVPYGFDENKLNAIIENDSGSANGYYLVSATKPSVIKKDDKILTFETRTGYQTVTYYILVPSVYDEAKVNDAKASFAGRYEYWTIYTVNPTKQLSYDTVETWVKYINGKAVTRYMLLPVGYSEKLLNDLKYSDIHEASMAYYTVSTTYPGIIASGDIVYTWYNETEKMYKYMILPLGFDIAKKNDAVLKDTKTVEYYRLYSKEPEKLKFDDKVQIYMYSGNQVGYMLLPQISDPKKIEEGLKGIT